jgi:hypothetical protein
MSSCCTDGNAYGVLQAHRESTAANKLVSAAAEAPDLRWKSVSTELFCKLALTARVASKGVQKLRTAGRTVSTDNIHATSAPPATGLRAQKDATAQC